MKKVNDIQNVKQALPFTVCVSAVLVSVSPFE